MDSNPNPKTERRKQNGKKAGHWNNGIWNPGDRAEHCLPDRLGDQPLTQTPKQKGEEKMNRWDWKKGNPKYSLWIKAKFNPYEVFNHYSNKRLAEHDLNERLGKDYIQEAFILPYRA